MRPDSRLPRSFFDRPTLQVARELPGKALVYGETRGIITETEAYIGRDDPACHAARGRTKRTETMFSKAGHAYVYLIYGMYHCLNFVTEAEDFPAAVLVRGIVIEGESPKTLNGPGKLCRRLGITRADNGTDIMQTDHFYVAETGISPPLEATPRIGISSGTDKLWRFLAPADACL